MPGIQNPKIDTSRLLLSASIAVSTQAMGSAPADTFDSPADHFYALGGALAASNGFAASRELQDATSKHPEWHWLPGYKWDSLKKHPYTSAGRTWEVLSGEIGPVVSVFALHYLSKRAGLHYQALTNEDGRNISDYVMRLGDTIGDVASTDTTSELLWRLFASNVDLIHSPEFANASERGQSILWAMKRVLAYAPMLTSSLPEALRQHVLHSIGFAGIAFETPALNEHFGLTFVSSSSSGDRGNPPSAYLDLDFVKREKPFADPEGRFEQALVSLDTISREHNITKIRFYPSVLGDQRKGGKLALFVRPFFDNKPGPLVRFPASFGSSHDRIWWTDAVDRGILQGVYNDDQYTVVKYMNEFLNYKKHLITPVSDRVIEKLPALMSWAAEQPTANDYGFNFAQQMHTAAEPDVVTIDDGVNMGLPGRPKQSTHHTAINAGDNGFLFIDDYFSQRVELPILTFVTRSRYGDIKLDDLLKLEKHLPWRQYRGSEKIAFTLAKSQAYSFVVNALMKSRSDELIEHRQSTKKFSTLLDKPDGRLLGMLKEYADQVSDGKNLQEAYDDQSKLVTSKHTSAFQTFDKASKELIQTQEARAALQAQTGEKDKEIAASQAELAVAKKAHEDILEKVPAKGKAKIGELQLKAAALHDAKNAGEKRILITAKENSFNALARDKKYGLAELGDSLTALNEKGKAVQDIERSRLKLIDDLKGFDKTLSGKRTAVKKAASDNKELAKLAQIQALLFLSTAEKNDPSVDTSPETVKAKLTEIEEHGKTLGLSDGSGMINSVKEFIGTAYKALPLPKSWKQQPSAKTTPQQAAGEENQTPIKATPSGKTKTGKGNPRSVAAVDDDHPTIDVEETPKKGKQPQKGRAAKGGTKPTAEKNDPTDDISAETVKAKLTEVEEHGKTLGLSNGNGMINSVKEFIGTAYQALPLPKSWKQQPSAKTTPQQAAGEKNQTPIKSTPSGKTKTGKINPRSVPAVAVDDNFPTIDFEETPNTEVDKGKETREDATPKKGTKTTAATSPKKGKQPQKGRANKGGTKPTAATPPKKDKQPQKGRANKGGTKSTAATPPKEATKTTAATPPKEAIKPTAATPPKEATKTTAATPPKKGKQPQKGRATKGGKKPKVTAGKGAKADAKTEGAVPEGPAAHKDPIAIPSERVLRKRPNN